MDPGGNSPAPPVYGMDLDAGGVPRALAAASKDRTPQWRATADGPGSFVTPA